MDELEEESGEGQANGGFQVEQLKSYLLFARRAVAARWKLAATLFVVGSVLTFCAAAFLPRTFMSRTVLMAMGSTLDRNDGAAPLTGAEGLIMRHENLEAMIRDTGLVKTDAERRPPLLKTKDRIMGALFGKPDDETKMAILVGTLETRLEISTEKGQLSVDAAWTDGESAAKLAEAARESFLKARHTAEMSAIEDKMAILDGHATKLREEVAALADQMNQTRESAVEAQPKPATPAAPAAPRVIRVAAPATHNPDNLVAEQVAGLKEKLAADKPKLAELENDWARRLRDEQGKLAEMKLRLTPSHPEVVTEEGRVAMLSQVPSEVSSLRAEITTLEGDIKARDLMAARPTTAVVSGAAPAEQLPVEVMQALEKDDADPALRAQLSGAIIKYGDLRNDVRSARIELDTAQAAFNHRYQLIIPAEVPSKPTKPKPGVIVGGGLVASLLLALLLPILGELRRGIIVERWQVQHLQLPVLAELHLPPHDD